MTDGPREGVVASAEPRQEIELKRRLVGERAADALVAALGTPRSDHRQINHVFDTPAWGLHLSHHSLRVRDEEGAFTLTAKGSGRRVSSDVSTRTEAEAQIDEDTARQILAGGLDPIAVLRERVTEAAFDELWRGMERARGDEPLLRVGEIRNRRRTVEVTISLDVTLQVEVDQTRFPDGSTDEEVEIELDRAELAPRVESWLDAFGRQFGIETGPSSPKLARFYAALARADAPTST